MKFSICWVIFLSGLLLLFSADYGLRLLNGDVKTGGIDIVLGVVFIISIGALASYVQYRFLQTTNLSSLIQYSILALQAMLGFIIFAAAGFFYTIKFGIDSL